MKPTLRSLRKGEEVWAIVEEPIAGGEVIINFAGDLVRVQNKTEKLFRVGQRVLLQVQSITPLKFKLLFKPSLTRQHYKHIDLSM